MIFVPSIIPSGTFTAYAYPFMYRQATIAFGPSSMTQSPAVCRSLVETIKVGPSDTHIPVLDGAGLAPCATSSTPVPVQNPYPEGSATGSSSRNSPSLKMAPSWCNAPCAPKNRVQTYLTSMRCLSGWGIVHDRLAGLCRFQIRVIESCKDMTVCKLILGWVCEDEQE